MNPRDQHRFRISVDRSSADNARTPRLGSSRHNAPSHSGNSTSRAHFASFGSRYQESGAEHSQRDNRHYETVPALSPLPYDDSIDFSYLLSDSEHHDNPQAGTSMYGFGVASSPAFDYSFTNSATPPPASPAYPDYTDSYWQQSGVDNLTEQYANHHFTGNYHNSSMHSASSSRRNYDDLLPPHPTLGLDTPYLSSDQHSYSTNCDKNLPQHPAYQYTIDIGYNWQSPDEKVWTMLPIEKKEEIVDRVQEHRSYQGSSIRSRMMKKLVPALAQDFLSATDSRIENAVDTLFPIVGKNRSLILWMENLTPNQGRQIIANLMSVTNYSRKSDLMDLIFKSRFSSADAWQVLHGDAQVWEYVAQRFRLHGGGSR
ncbi:hypothetical protein CBS101457_000239 [Exobasidium rhododendri]|nr:hypothetical protein CBS101457_000239 [Exobasidium rhododendri]